MKKVIVSVIILSMLATPVYAADVDILETQPATEEVLSASDEFEDGETVLELEDLQLEQLTEAEEAVTVSSDAIEEDLSDDSVTAATAEVVPADGKSISQYYRQCKWCCADGYDIIEVYVRDGIDGQYLKRAFLVYNQETNEWVRYNPRSAFEADSFLFGYDLECDLFVPIPEREDYQEVLHEDNPATKLDESRIPVIMEEDFQKLPYYWQELSEIPFVKDGNNYEYAWEYAGGYPDPDPELDRGFKDTTFECYASVSFEVNNTKYAVAWTQAVQYDGRAHIWAKTPKVNRQKQSADVTVRVYRSGAMINPNSYSVAFKDNVNVTGFNGKNVQPSFTISLKGKYRKDNANMSKEKFGFDITPCPIDQGDLQLKKLVVEGEKVGWNGLFFVFKDGRKIALSKHDYKKNTAGTATIEMLSGNLWITGYNNFSGMIEMPLGSPKKVTYEW